MQLPPLRERPEDIPLLAQYLLDKFAARIARRFNGIDPGTMRRLDGVSRGRATSANFKTSSSAPPSSRPARRLKSIPKSSVKPDPKAADKPSAALKDVERSHILAVLGQTNWVIDGPAVRPPSSGFTPTPFAAV